MVVFYSGLKIPEHLTSISMMKIQKTKKKKRKKIQKTDHTKCR